jgi:hypothetical protein
MTRLRNQDGLIREGLYVFLAIAIFAVVMLDGMSIVNANRSVGNDAASAADAARTAYADSQDVTAAKAAAADYLSSTRGTMTGFSSVIQADGTVGFTVGVREHADTYVFKFLAYIPGLKKWTHDMTDPKATRSSS